jgi:hypothetical protein
MSFRTPRGQGSTFTFTLPVESESGSAHVTEVEARIHHDVFAVPQAASPRHQAAALSFVLVVMTHPVLPPGALVAPLWHEIEKVIGAVQDVDTSRIG